MEPTAPRAPRTGMTVRSLALFACVALVGAACSGPAEDETVNAVTARQTLAAPSTDLAATKQAQATGTSDGPRIPDADGPCINSRPVPVPAALSQVPPNAPQWFPRASSSVGQVSEFWSCPSGTWVYGFDTGVSLSFEPDWAAVDPEAHWAAYVEQNRYGSVMDLREGVGVVEEPDTNHTGQVMLVEADYLIRALGNGSVSASHLVELVRTLDGSGERSSG